MLLIMLLCNFENDHQEIKELDTTELVDTELDAKELVDIDDSEVIQNTIR